MNIYSQKLRWKYILLALALLIGLGSIFYTNNLVDKLEYEERKKAETWANAMRLLIDMSADLNGGASLKFIFDVIENNETVPCIYTDGSGNIQGHKNFDSLKVAQQPNYLESQLKKLMEENPPIVIDYGGEEYNYVYYSRSKILSILAIYPFVQLSVIMIFILVAYVAFSSSRKAEQNQVWVGLSKETAHQLGTPVSSLLAWKEILKLKNPEEDFTVEFEKDISRLEKITDRFSKIGSKPMLREENLVDVVNSVVSYLKTRSSGKVSFNVVSDNKEVFVPLNASLFEWVIENTCKNAMDAIEGKGEISFIINNDNNTVNLDIKDSGKGIPRNKQKTVFKPGFTTKKRGWGLGLSLTKRIVEEYHNGKIFVAESVVNKGTTIRVILNK